jgi:hypothetical protein
MIQVLDHRAIVFNEIAGQLARLVFECPFTGPEPA